VKHRILVLELDIRLFDAQSLKDKRKVKRRLVDKLKAAYNLSIAETEHLDKWQRIGLTVAYVAVDQGTAKDMADTLRGVVDGLLEGEGELLGADIDIL
jgi:uncharacterized protein YlxP (DUF503 family)